MVEKIDVISAVGHNGRVEVGKVHGVRSDTSKLSMLHIGSPPENVIPPPVLSLMSLFLKSSSASSVKLHRTPAIRLRWRGQ